MSQSLMITSKEKQIAGMKDLVKVTGMTDLDIILQIRDEFDRGDAAMVNVKQDLEADYKLYRSQKRKQSNQYAGSGRNSRRSRDRIGDWTVFSTHSALMARSYITRPESAFESSNIGEDFKVKNLNNALEEDFNDDDMEIVKYWRDFYKYLFGVGITVRNGWDGLNKKSTFQNIDPRQWVPDPDGDYAGGRYAFSGFNRDVYKNELIEWGLWNEDLLIEDRQTTRIQDPKVTDQQNVGINTQYHSSSQEKHNPDYRIYYHFTTFIGEKGMQMAMVITGNSNGLVLGVKLLDTMPFAFSYWRPDNTPMGMRVTSISGDAQRVKAEIANLRLDKSKAELYPMYIRNKRIIPNAADLEFGFNKIIDANPLEGESVTNGLVPLQKDFRADNSFVIDQSLDATVEGATSIGRVAQGSSPERREGVGTNELIADSTDTNLALNAKIEAWGEKQLLKLYLNGLKENLTAGDKKRVNIMTSYGIVPRELKRSDFALGDNITIKIVTVVEKEKKDNKLRLAYGTAIGLIQNLNLSESAKRFLYRDYFDVIGLDTEKAERIIDYTPDEIEALVNVSLLNEGLQVDVKEEYDPMTHLSAIKAARPGENVDLYKYSLLKLYKIKGKQAGPEQQQQMQDEGVANNLAAQAMSNVANETQQTLAK